MNILLKPARSFDKTLVSAIGRNSSTPEQGIAFCIGDTTKSFQMAGKHFELKDSLKMSASGIAKKSANVFKILTLGSFKPNDLLVFKLF